jgi:aspartyl-tRNA(Asn)/glutamyl-tRNA(Gln) amidotransferase subunit C
VSAHTTEYVVCADTALGSLAVVSDRITTDVVAKVARLARLDLTPDELEAATAELGDMLDHFADIDALELSDVAPMTQPYRLVNVMRDDVEEPCLDRDEVLAAAPQAEDGRFRVPPALGEDG